MKLVDKCFEWAIGHLNLLVDTSAKIGRRLGLDSLGPTRPFKRFYRKLSPLARSFVSNVLIGIVVEISLVLLSNVPQVQVVQNQIFDMLMIAYQEMPLPSNSKRVPIRLIEIDEETYRDRRWGGGEPVIAPRAQLAQVIAAALQSGAAQVVVDIALDNRATDEEAELIQKINQSSHDASTHQHLLLVRSLRFAQASQDTPSGTGLALPSLRRSVWDGLADTDIGTVHLHNVAPNFVLSGDHVVREWKLWEIACIEGERDTRMVVLPSVQLELYAVRRGSTTAGVPWNKPQLVTEQVDGRAVPCVWAKTTASRLEHNVRQWIENNLTDLRIGDDRAANRIFFSIPWHSKFASPVISTDSDGRPVSLFRSYSAQQLLGVDAFGQAPPPLPSLRGAVVLIGQTFSESRDFHTTPIGVMPGVIVVANAVDTIFAFDALREPAVAYRIGFTAIVIVLAAFAFAKWPKSRFVNWSFAVALILLLPLTAWLFRRGIWLEIAIPLVAIKIHTAMETRRHGAKRERRKLSNAN